MGPILYVVGVVVGAVVLSYILRHFVFKWLSKTASRTKTKLDDIIVREIGSAISWLVYLAAAYYLVLYFYPIPGLLQFVIAAGVLITGKSLVNIILGAFEEYVGILPVEEDQKQVLLGMKGTISAILYLLIVLVMLASVGIDVWPLITSLGVTGLAVSLALKDVLTDYVSGVIVIIGRALKKGDYVLVKDKGVEGTIQEIGWRYTVLETPEGETVTIPNRVISSSVIIFKKAQ